MSLWGVGLRSFMQRLVLGVMLLNTIYFLSKKINGRGSSIQNLHEFSRASDTIDIYCSKSTNETSTSAVVSYVLYVPFIPKPAKGKKRKITGKSSTKVVISPQQENVYSKCLENLNEFVLRAVKFDSSVHYIFSLIGDTQLPKSLEEISSLGNVQIIRTRQYPVDLYAHGAVLKKYLSSRVSCVNTFICLNCGVRGPYLIPDKRDEPVNSEPSTTWIQKFTSKLNDDVKCVGPTISCEISPHVQSYAVAFDRVGASIVTPVWSPLQTGDKLEIIRNAEVGASEEILKRGYNIAALQARQAGRDFRSPSLICDPEYPEIGTGQLINPIRCDLNTTDGKTWKPKVMPGCKGLEPCEVMFVKYGGEVLEKNLIALSTKVRINTEDTHWILDQPMCNPADIKPSEPLLNYRPPKPITTVTAELARDYWLSNGGKRSMKRSRKKSSILGGW